MVLSDTEIWAALDSGQLIVEPPPLPKRVSKSALDLTLGDRFWGWDVPEGESLDITVNLSSPFPFAEAAKPFLKELPKGIDGSVILAPRGFVLAMTAEDVDLPRTSRLAARVEGRSGLARLGIAVHLTAPVIHAGWHGNIALEITNHGPFPVRLKAGQALCQLVIEHVFGTPSGKEGGFFQGQTTPLGNPNGVGS
jgi:dCTP deaminase